MSETAGEPTPILPLQESSTGRVEKPEEGKKNLEIITERLQGRMREIAEALGGQYIPPTDEENGEKFTRTLEISDSIPWHPDEKGALWSSPTKFPTNLNHIKAYNESGLHGVIIIPSKEAEEGNTMRVYRGCTFYPDQPQIAPLARIKGVTVQDIHDYVEGKKTMDQIIKQIADERTREYLKDSLARVRNDMKKYQTTELEELLARHTMYTSGAEDIDLWVSAVKDPTKTYRRDSAGNVWGDFLTCDGKNGIDCVLVLDIPEDEIHDYKNSSEVAILAEIKKKWIRAIVPSAPSQGKINKSIEKVDTLTSQPPPADRRWA
jgi:hypothetical protein